MAAMGHIRPAFAFFYSSGGRARLSARRGPFSASLAPRRNPAACPRPLQDGDVPWVFSAFLLIRDESCQQLSTVLPQEPGESCKPRLLTSSRLRRQTGSALYQPRQLCQRNQLLQPAVLIRTPPSPDFCCRYRGKKVSQRVH